MFKFTDVVGSGLGETTGSAGEQTDESETERLAERSGKAGQSG